MLSLNESIEMVSKNVGLFLEDFLPIGDYVYLLRNVISSVRTADNNEIKKLPYTENIISTILADKVLMETRFHDLKDQISMFSTLIIYIACQKEGLPDHSKIYMDRVTALRKKINEYFGEETQKFCGS